MLRFHILLLAAALAAGQERYRPQFHFAPGINWTNDPCGLVFANGEYHLFFQYNPFGDRWGHMSWGHAVSRDLLNWRELPVAIPEGSDAMIFTGSSVVDAQNTSGLCRPGTSCIVSIYTGHKPRNQSQYLAFSQDGRTWTKYAGNPVLDIGQADFRDPKVFWHAPSRQWVMLVVLPVEKRTRLYGSPNLRDWKHLSDFGPEGAVGGIWECPELFELPVDGNASDTRWILKIGLNPGHIAGGSGEQYFVGRFDGARFRNDNAPDVTLWLDYGRDCYCALTWNGEPKGQPLHLIGWMNNWQYAGAAPTSPWRGSMTLPRALGLRRTPAGIRLVQTPLPELESWRVAPFTYRGASVADLNRRLAAHPLRSQTFELDAEVRPGTASRLEWRLLAGGEGFTTVGYDVAARQIYVDRTRSGQTGFHKQFPSRTTAPLELPTGILSLRILVDRSSVEVFAGGGLVSLTNLVFPQPDSLALSLVAEGGDPADIRVRVWSLRPKR